MGGREGRGGEQNSTWQDREEQEEEEAVTKGARSPGREAGTTMINRPAPWFPQGLVLILGNYTSVSLNRT